MNRAMKIFVCTNFKGYWPVPTAALVVGANSPQHAAELLLEELRNYGLGEGNDDIGPNDLVEIQTLLDAPKVHILADGNY